MSTNQDVQIDANPDGLDQKLGKGSETPRPNNNNNGGKKGSGSGKGGNGTPQNRRDVWGFIRQARITNTLEETDKSSNYTLAIGTPEENVSVQYSKLADKSQFQLPVKLFTSSVLNLVTNSNITTRVQTADNINAEPIVFPKEYETLTQDISDRVNRKQEYDVSHVFDYVSIMQYAIKVIAIFDKYLSVAKYDKALQIGLNKQLTTLPVGNIPKRTFFVGHPTNDDEMSASNRYLPEIGQLLVKGDRVKIIDALQSLRKLVSTFVDPTNLGATNYYLYSNYFADSNDSVRSLYNFIPTAEELFAQHQLVNGRLYRKSQLRDVDLEDSDSIIDWLDDIYNLLLSFKKNKIYKNVYQDIAEAAGYTDVNQLDSFPIGKVDYDNPRIKFDPKMLTSINNATIGTTLQSGYYTTYGFRYGVPNIVAKYGATSTFMPDYATSSDFVNQEKVLLNIYDNKSKPNANDIYHALRFYSGVKSDAVRYFPLDSICMAYFSYLASEDHKAPVINLKYTGVHSLQLATHVFVEKGFSSLNQKGFVNLRMMNRDDVANRVKTYLQRLSLISQFDYAPRQFNHFSSTVFAQHGVLGDDTGTMDNIDSVPDVFWEAADPSEQLDTPEDIGNPNTAEDLDSDIAMICDSDVEETFLEWELGCGTSISKGDFEGYLLNLAIQVVQNNYIFSK